MKILFVVPNLVVGGVTTVVLSIINNLKKSNVDVKLVTLFDHCDVDIDGVDYQSLGLISIFNIPYAIFRMREVINSFKPDIVHAHTLYSNLLVCFCSYFNKNYKLICSEHGTYTSKLKFYKRMYLFKIMNSIADLITNVSDTSCESYIKQNIVPREKMRTMYNGIDLNKFKFSMDARLRLREDLKISDHTKIIGFVGRLSREKNLLNLINAVALLDLDYKLVIIGNGPELNNIKKIVNEKGIDQKVIFLGELKNPSEYYSVFDLLVLSSDTEGLPTVILEAIASKCPVVATDCGGVKELFPKGYSFIIPIKNHTKLHGAIKSILLLSLDEKNHLIGTCHNYVVEKFSSIKVSECWLGVYRGY